jgi:hypothetical protein
LRHGSVDAVVALGERLRFWLPERGGYIVHCELPSTITAHSPDEHVRHYDTQYTLQGQLTHLRSPAFEVALRSTMLQQRRLANCRLEQ